MTLPVENAPVTNVPVASGKGLDVRNATVTYRNGHVGLADATFDVPPGSITALVGINGSGKSTLFKAIMGLVQLATGAITVLQRPVPEALKRNLVAYVPQSEEVDWNFPVLVEDVVMMGRQGRMNLLRIPSAADKRAVDDALARVDMIALRKRQIGELSGGQKKRAFLARALAQESRVILLDEPFTGVDVTTEDAIIRLLGELRDEGRVMLVSTHNLGTVPEFCDRAVLLDRTVLAAGPTVEVFTRANLERAFGGVLRQVSFGDESDALGILTDDERPLILVKGRATPRARKDEGSKDEAAKDEGGS